MRLPGRRRHIDLRDSHRHDNYIDMVPRHSLMLHRTMRRRPSYTGLRPGLSEGTFSEPI
jgi:hypothetical protein